MKRIIGVITVIVTLLMITNVYADNYKMRELIPHDKKITIRGDNILYKDIEYKDGTITIGTIKNQSEDKRNITVSIGLFDENRRNITIINYCSEKESLDPDMTQTNYTIKFDESKFADEKTLKDVKYYTILSENINCRRGGEKEFVGKRVQDVNSSEINELPEEASLLISILKIIGVGIVILFLYKFLFTGAYRNMNGEDTRGEFDYINKNLEKERKKRFIDPNQKVEKKNKSDEIKAQEEEQNKKENKENSDIHNFFK